MSGTLNTSVSRIIRKLLIDLGVAVDAGSTPWPAYSGKEPTSPDNCITVYNTTDQDQERTMVDGKRHLLHGAQIRVRCDDETDGAVKANAIAIALDTVDNRTVSVDGDTYTVGTVSIAGGVLGIGANTPKNKLQLFTINVLVQMDKDS